LWAVLGVFVLTLPAWLSTSRLDLATVVVLFGIVAASLVVLTGWAGQVSLGHMAFVGVGGAGGGGRTEGGGDLAIAMVGAGLVGACAAAVVGYAGLRRRGLTLAVSTLAFALATGAYRSNRTGWGRLAARGRVRSPTHPAVPGGVRDLGLPRRARRVVAGPAAGRPQRGAVRAPAEPGAVLDGGHRWSGIAAGSSARGGLRPGGRLLPAARLAVPGQRGGPAVDPAGVPVRARRDHRRRARRSAAVGGPAPQVGGPQPGRRRPGGGRPAQHGAPGHDRPRARHRRRGVDHGGGSRRCGGAARRGDPMSRVRSYLEGITGGAPVFPLGVLFGLNMADELDRTALGVLLPEIRDHFGTSTSGILTVVSLALIAGLALAVPIGYYADRVKRVPIAVGGAALWGGFSALTGLAPNLWTLGVARTGAALGRAVNDPVHNSLLADYYDIPVRPKVYSVHRYANAFGAAVGPLGAGLIAASFGWRTPFILFAFVTAALLVVAVRLREPLRGRWERQAAGASAEILDVEEEAPT